MRRPRALVALATATVTALAVLSPPPALAQMPALGDFDAYVAQAVRDWGIPGLAISVVKDGEVVFAKGYGVRRLGSPEPVDDRTLFAIGSTTKAMTAAALGMLVDEGKLAWDDPVSKHLPWFALKDAWATRELTVRDLLTHRSGLPSTDAIWYEQRVTTREILDRLRLVPSETSMRSHFTYQNVMYAAAGEVVAAVSGMPWRQFVVTRLFEPLGMSATAATAATLERQPNVAAPHSQVGGAVAVIRNASADSVAPAGAVWSNVRDMAQWLQLLLGGGLVAARADGTTPRRLLSDAVLTDLFTPQTMVGPDDFYPMARLTKPHWTTYGLGWFQTDYAGEKVDFHTGSIDGMVALAGLIRDQGLGVYVLANMDGAELRHALMFKIFDLYLGRPARDWSSELRVLYRELAKEADARQQKVDAERVPGTKPALALARYAGTYTSPVFGAVTVFEQAGRLHVRYGEGFVGPLEHWHYDTFKATWEAAWRGTALLTFQIDQRGSLASVSMPQGVFARTEK